MTLPDAGADDRVRVIFIAGAGRTGTTLLDLILGQLPGFVSGGELIPTDRIVVSNGSTCSCGAAVHACPFWAPVIARAFPGLDAEQVERTNAASRKLRPWPRAALRFLPLIGRQARARLCVEGGRFVPLYRAMLAVAGAKVLIDSSKGPAHGLALLARPELDVHVVHLVRDSRATNFSWTRRPFTKRWPVWLAALRWAERGVGVPLLRFGARSYVRVRYEDLISQPRVEVERILASLSEEGADLAFLDGEWTPKRHHMLSGNPRVRSSERIRLSLDDEWRTAMPLLDRLVITALTWPLLIAFGYPLRS